MHRIAPQFVRSGTGRAEPSLHDGVVAIRSWENSDLDRLLDLAWNIDNPTILQWCRDHGVRYLNTSVELWDRLFATNRERQVTRWARDPFVIARPAQLGPQHALADAPPRSDLGQLDEPVGLERLQVVVDLLAGEPELVG